MISRMSRRTVFLTSIIATAISFFTLGLTGARRSDAAAQAFVRGHARGHSQRSEERTRKGRERRVARRDRRHAWPARPPLGSRRDGRRDQGGAEERDGAHPASAAARSAFELRRAVFLRQPRQDELRHGRVPGRRVFHHRQARRRRASPRRRTGRSGRKIVSIKIVYQGKEIPAKVVDYGRRRRRSAQRRLGDHQDAELDLPPLRADTAYRVRLCGSDLPAGQRLLEGHHSLDRLRRPADARTVW